GARGGRPGGARRPVGLPRGRAVVPGLRAAHRRRRDRLAGPGGTRPGDGLIRTPSDGPTCTLRPTDPHRPGRTAAHSPGWADRNRPDWLIRADPHPPERASRTTRTGGGENGPVDL